MKKFNREQNKKMNRVTLIGCTIISFILMAFTIIIRYGKIKAGIGFYIESYGITWICVYIMFIVVYWAIELFNGFSKENLLRKALTIVIFIFVLTMMIIKIVHNGI